MSSLTSIKTIQGKKVLGCNCMRANMAFTWKLFTETENETSLPNRD